MALDESAVIISNITEPEGDATTSHQGTDRYRTMFLAALKGNWKAANKILENDPAAATARITRNSMTALHVAAGEGRHEFVERMVEMVSLISPDSLKLQDGAGYTALHHAAIAGSVRASAALVKKNHDLTNVLDNKGQTPLLLASRFVYGNYDVLWYLTMVTDDEPGNPFTGTPAMDLVLMLVLSGSLDILLYLLERYDGLATASTAEGASLLSLLAVTPSNFLSGTKLGFWESFIYSVITTRKSYEAPDYVRSLVEESRAEVSQPYPLKCTKLVHQVLQQPRRLFFAAIRHLTPSFIKRLQRAKHKHHCAVKLFEHVCAKISKTNDSLTDYFINHGGILYQATSLGIIEILEIMFQLCPDLMWVSLEEDKFPIHTAVENRRENIFKLLCKKNARNKIQSDQVTTSGTTIMHYAAKLAPFEQLSAVSGAALQMQQEMKWFKEVEKLVHPYFRTKKNGEGKTPRELFSEEHKALAEAGEKWMKDTSNSCMIVSTLIATVVFAAAFKVPGGNRSETGIPIFLWTNAFLVFAVSDALALFSSLTSVLMFLSIMTARYAEEDFMESLPKRLVIGLASLFLAITTVMVSFGATLSIVLEERLKWIVAPTVCLSCVPVGLFIFLQLPLFIKMVRSTFGSGFRPERT